MLFFAMLISRCFFSLQSWLQSISSQVSLYCILAMCHCRHQHRVVVVDIVIVVVVVDCFDVAISKTLIKGEILLPRSASIFIFIAFEIFTKNEKNFDGQPKKIISGFIESFSNMPQNKVQVKSYCQIIKENKSNEAAWHNGQPTCFAFNGLGFEPHRY